MNIKEEEGQSWYQGAKHPQKQKPKLPKPLQSPLDETRKMFQTSLRKHVIIISASGFCNSNLTICLVYKPQRKKSPDPSLFENY